MGWMNAIEQFSKLSGTMVALGANLLLQSTILILAGLLLFGLVRGKGAALQSAILRTTLAAVLLCPLASLLIDATGFGSLTIHLPQPSLQAIEKVDPTAMVNGPSGGDNWGGLRPAAPSDLDLSHHSMDSALDASVDPPPANIGLLPGPSVSDGSGDATRLDTAQQGETGASRLILSPLAILYLVLTIVWSVVSLFMLTRLSLCHLRIRRVRRSGRVADQVILTECRAQADKLGIRMPSVVVSPQIQSPCLVGFFHPAIVLPEADTAASQEVLLHELAHLARRDCLWNLLCRTATAVVFFQPLIWVLSRRIETASDEVCDDCVVQHGLDRRSYARQLLAIAERFQPAAPEVVAGVGVIAFKSSLGQRVSRILDRTRCLSIRAGAGGIMAIVALGIFATLMSGLIGIAMKDVAGSAAKAEALDPIGPTDTLPTGWIRVRDLHGDIGTFQVRNGDWLPIGAGLHWCYVGGNRLSFMQDGSYVYIAIDGSPRRLVGIRLKALNDLEALKATLSEDAEPLVVWCECPVLDQLATIPHRDRISGLQVKSDSEIIDLTPLSKLSELTLLNLSYCSSLDDLSPLTGVTNLTSLDLSNCTRIKDLSPLTKLSKLISLNLSHCHGLSDLSPLTGLTNLTSMDLSQPASTDQGLGGGSLPRAQFSDFSPLSKLAKLNSLNLTGCVKLSDLSPFQSLTNLTSLNLAWCESVTDLSPLQNLNNLSEIALPPGTTNKNLRDFVANRANLRSLCLIDCHQISDLSPLARAKGLASLSLIMCSRISDLSPLANLTELNQLNVRGSLELTDLAPVAKLTKLATLRFGECKKLSNLTPLAGLANLTEFSLTSCPEVVDISPLANLTDLMSLTIGWCKRISDISALANLANIESLELLGCDRLSKLPSLARLTKLRSLQISECGQLSDLEPLGQLVGLRSLSLYGCREVSDLSPLARFTNLTSLDLMDCEHVSDLSPLTALNQLEDINLRGCKNLKNLSGLAQMKKLSSISLQGSIELTDLSPLANLSQLTYLGISDCDKVSDLTPLVGMTNMQRLFLARCKSISNLGPLAKMSKLIDLNLGECPEVADLSPLANLTNLRKLQLGGCKKISDLTPLANLANLTKLYMYGCEQISDLSPLRAMVRRGVTIVVDERIRAQLEALRTARPIEVGEPAPLTQPASPREVVQVDPLKVGDLAPLFAVQTVDGKPLKLEDYHGKVVLLYFWATWCGPCLGSMPALEQLYEEFKENDRFAMISLSLDENPFPPRRYAEREGLKWPQGFLGKDSPIRTSYNVKGIPAYYLIGPDGRIIAANLNISELKAAIQQDNANLRKSDRSDVSEATRFAVNLEQVSIDPQIASVSDAFTKTNAPPERTVHFPKDHSVGALKVMDWDKLNEPFSIFNWTSLSKAQGEVVIPAGKALMLGIKPLISQKVSGGSSILVIDGRNKVTDFSFLSALRPDDLQILRSSNSKELTDDDLVPLKRLTSLISLDLSSTKISDWGLINLKELKSLQQLSLFNTSITDKGLVHLKDLSSLKLLSLYETEVTGSGLAHLKGLKRLESLDLAGTPITDASLIHLKNMPWLKKLRMYDTDISDHGLAHLKSMPSLEELIVGHLYPIGNRHRSRHIKYDLARITDAGVSHIDSLTTLKSLSLYRTQITDAGLKHLGRMVNLESLSLLGAPISGEGLVHLKGLTALRYLDLKETQVTGPGLVYLKSFRDSLEELDLSGTKIQDKDLVYLKELHSLKRLTLSDTSISKAGLEHIKDLPALESVRIHGSKLSKEDLEKGIDILPLPPLRIGDVAPDFSVKALDGYPLKLSDYRGKFVLLNCWASWCGPCIQEIPNLKAVYDAYGQNERFVLIGLSLDKTVDEAKKCIIENDLKWIQGFLGEQEEAIQTAYRFRGIPRIWLIGPDGKILAKDLGGPTMKNVVRRVLDALSATQPAEKVDAPKGVPKTLEFQLGKWAEVSEATRFAVNLDQVSIDPQIASVNDEFTKTNAPSERTVYFPKDRCMGQLSVRDRGSTYLYFVRVAHVLRDVGA